MKNLLFIFPLTIGFSSLVNAQNADSVTYFLQKGNEAKSSRLFMQAYQQYKKALQYDSSNTDVQKELGNVCMEMRKYQEAIIAYSVVIKKNPNDITANENLANLYFWTRKWNDAITIAKKMKEQQIGKNANYILGKSYYELEDYGQSYTYLQAAYKEDSTNAEIPYTIGRSFVEMSNYRAAAAFFTKAIALDTSKPRWVYECALNYAAIPNDKEAVNYYLLAAQRGYKTDNDYYENLSISYQGLGQMDKCIELLKKVLEKKPADLELLNSIADAHFKIGKYQEAIDYWDRILGFDKQNAKALYMIGLSYQKKGDKAKGQQLCDQAIKMDPSLANMRHQKSMPGM